MTSPSFRYRPIRVGCTGSAPVICTTLQQAVLGAKDGAKLGTVVGTALGASVGANDGISVLKSSALVGEMVGTTDGAVLGTRVGTAVGAMVQLTETGYAEDHCEPVQTYQIVVLSGHSDDRSSRLSAHIEFDL